MPTPATTQPLTPRPTPHDVPPPSVPEAPSTRETFDSLLRAVGAVIVAVIAVAFLLGLTGCGGPIFNPTTPQEPRSAATTPNADRQNAINRVCWQFHEYTPADLARPTVEGDIAYLAGLPGVPPALRTVIVGYWNDPAVRKPSTPAGKAAADLAYQQTDAACRDHLWSRSMKASDQPPKK